MATPSLLSRTVGEFLNDLASDQPTPGGGAAAALAGALAAGLGQMVGAITLRHPPAGDAAERLRACVAHLDRARQMLTQLIDEDAAAFGELSAALRLSRDDPERAKRVAQAASLAAEVPLETATVSRRVQDELKTLAGLAGAHVQCDAQAAIHLAGAASRAAATSVRANLPLMAQEGAKVVEEQLAAALKGLEA